MCNAIGRMVGMYAPRPQDVIVYVQGSRCSSMCIWYQDVQEGIYDFTMFTKWLWDFKRDRMSYISVHDIDVYDIWLHDTQDICSFKSFKI